MSHLRQLQPRLTRQVNQEAPFGASLGDGNESGFPTSRGDPPFCHSYPSQPLPPT